MCKSVYFARPPIPDVNPALFGLPCRRIYTLWDFMVHLCSVCSKFPWDHLSWHSCYIDLVTKMRDIADMGNQSHRGSDIQPISAYGWISAQPTSRKIKHPPYPAYVRLSHQTTNAAQQWLIRFTKTSQQPLSHMTWRHIWQPRGNQIGFWVCLGSTHFPSPPRIAKPSQCSHLQK